MLRPSVLAVLGLVVAGLGLGACRESLDGDDTTEARSCKMGTSTECVEADNHADLPWIVDNVFKKSCAFSGCHNGATSKAGRIDVRTAADAHMDLVNVDSAVDPGRKLVVPGAPRQSYLMMMVQAIKPSEMEPTPANPPPSEAAGVGFMPQNTNGSVLCCQKLDALDRWITAGAVQ